MMGLPPPNEYTVIIAGIGIVFALVGFISWKLGQRKKAKLDKQQEELE